jgi:hypothetical protein
MGSRFGKSRRTSTNAELAIEIPEMPLNRRETNRELVRKILIAKAFVDEA